MTGPVAPPETLADVLTIISAADLPTERHRDMISAINRICELAGFPLAGLPADAVVLRGHLKRIRPTAAGISAKTFDNLKSLLAAALQLAGVIDPMGRGEARRDAAWGPLLALLAADKRLSNGLAAFANWCTANRIAPAGVTDEIVQRFLVWLETRTLYPKPRDLVRRIPRLWNQASGQYPSWPRTTLTALSFRPPRQRLAWEDLDPGFRQDGEAYLAMRANPDVFDDRPDAPRRPLAPATVHQQSEHLRLSASILIESGINVGEIVSLADLIQPERFKTILRHYHQRADGKPNAFAVSLAKTLIQVAKYHVGAAVDRIAELKRLASRLPPVPIDDLTPKNKALMRKFESERLRAKLLFLPEALLADVARELKDGASPFVKAQVAIAIDIQLATPLRPENLTELHWRHQLLEPDGPRGKLLLHVPAEQTKTKRRDLTFEIPDDVAQRLRWYRRNVLPLLRANPNGHLFVTEGGTLKSQETLSQQITEALNEHVGVHMTPHQFRHFAATTYLEDHPEDRETVKAMLGHSWIKTSAIYAGRHDRRAGRAYAKLLLEQRRKLRLSRANKPKRFKGSKPAGGN